MVFKSGNSCSKTDKLDKESDLSNQLSVVASFQF